MPCSHANCPRYYHVACGVKNKCLFEFYDEHKSFCHRHVEIKEKFAQHENWQKCFICDESMGEYNPITSIPSCCNQGYYHKECIQKHALSAASVTKCPSCGNTAKAEDYRQFLRSRGIYCPIRDASMYNLLLCSILHSFQLDAFVFEHFQAGKRQLLSSQC